MSSEEMQKNDCSLQVLIGFAPERIKRGRRPSYQQIMNKIFDLTHLPNQQAPIFEFLIQVFPDDSLRRIGSMGMSSWS